VVGSKRGKVTMDWRKLNNEELHDLYPSPNIICLITLRRIIWARHNTYEGEEEVIQGFVGEY
jgi:hypothetical protein